MLERDPIARSVYGIAANNPDDVASVCLATLAKYMENIVSNPAEEKYRKIRVGNKAFQVCDWLSLVFPSVMGCAK
jgi:UBX domain-containing protein 6